MTHQDRRSKYNPDSYRTPPEAQPAADFVHEHRRKYDRGLIPPPLSLQRSLKFAAVILVTSALSFFAAFWSIGSATTASCQQRQELTLVLRGILKEQEGRLRALSNDGTFSEALVEAAIKDNRASIKRLTFPPC